MMRTLNDHISALDLRVDPTHLWYVPNPRLRTQAASLEAQELIHRLLGPSPVLPEPTEQELFIALHTCAYRAARPARGKRIPARERRIWARRWEILREYIVKQNLGLVYTMIGRFRMPMIDEDDLISEAMYALTRGVERFNPWRGFKFSTYACNVIVRALVRRTKQERNYRERFPVQHDESYDQELNPPDASGDLWVERLRRALDRNTGDLTELESAILAKRFPPADNPRLTYRQIGQAIGLSKERVRQIQNIALDKLRETLVADPMLQ